MDPRYQSHNKSRLGRGSGVNRDNILERNSYESVVKPRSLEFDRDEYYINQGGPVSSSSKKAPWIIRRPEKLSDNLFNPILHTPKDCERFNTNKANQNERNRKA